MNGSGPNGCLEADTALSLAHLLSAEGVPSLRHITDCVDCRARVEEWSEIERAVAEMAVRPGFEDQVLANLPATSRRTASTWGFGLLNGALAFAAAASVFIFLRVMPGPPTLLTFAAVAAACAWGTTVFGGSIVSG